MAYRHSLEYALETLSAKYPYLRQIATNGCGPRIQGSQDGETWMEIGDEVWDVMCGRVESVIPPEKWAPGNVGVVEIPGQCPMPVGMEPIRFVLDKDKYRIRFEEETPERVIVVIEKK